MGSLSCRGVTQSAWRSSTACQAIRGRSFQPMGATLTSRRSTVRVRCGWRCTDTSTGLMSGRSVISRWRTAAVWVCHLTGTGGRLTCWLRTGARRFDELVTTYGATWPTWRVPVTRPLGGSSSGREPQLPPHSPSTLSLILVFLDLAAWPPAPQHGEPYPRQQHYHDEDRDHYRQHLAATDAPRSRHRPGLSLAPGEIPQ